MSITPPLATTERLWALLQPYVLVQHAVSFTFTLRCDESPKIVVEYIPDEVSAEAMVILLKQFQLVEHVIPDPEQIR